MLAELAIANAAFKIIKTTLSNGNELFSAGKAVTDYFGAEKDIAKAAASGKGNALEAYQAQQQLRKQEDELKYMLNKQGLLGYHNFLEFKAKFSREQKEVARLEAHKRHTRQAAIQENISVGLKAMGIIVIIIAALFGVALYLR